jgi:hypothetical protein
MQYPARRRAALTPALLAGAALAAAPLAAGLLAGNGTAGVALAADDSSGTTTIYRWVDAQGVVHYTDSPQPGAQQLHVQPAQTYRAPAIANVAEPDTAADAASAYQVCLINQPSQQQSFYAPEQVVVNVELVPRLHDGDQVTVTLDGQALPAADASGMDFQINAPFRGAHTLTAVVHDPSGRALCRAPPVTFYVRRPSLLSPQSPVGTVPGGTPGVAGVPVVPGGASVPRTSAGGAAAPPTSRLPAPPSAPPLPR